jgi:hypothetical protein
MVWIRRQLICTTALLACGLQARAQTEDINAVHWAYSTYFGSGWYRVSDAQDAFVMRYTPRRALSDARLDDDGTRRWGIEFRFPVTVGLNHFPLDDLPGSVDPENLASISVTPSVYLTWPANKRWMVRPFAAFGWGTLLNGDESAWAYWVGVKSRYVLHQGERELALLNSLAFVGYSPNDGSAEDFWPVMSALEFGHPLFRESQSGQQWRLNWHLSYTFFQNDLDLVSRNLETEPISDQWELGLALSREDASIPVWRFEFERLGLSYRFSSDGDLQGIGLVFSSLFDQ